MKDQAAKLRDLVQHKIKAEKEEEKASGPRIITIASGKGGVGKTNIVVNLGITLAQMGKRVLILDADLGLANVEVILGSISKFSLYDVLKGEKTLAEIMIDGPYNLKVIPGGTGFQELANLNKYQRDKIIEGMKVFNDSFDFILIDTGAGINKNVLGFLAAANEVIVVATPEPTSLTDAYSLIKVISKFKLTEEVSLLINMSSDEKEAKATAKKIQLVALKYLDITINNLGFVSNDMVVRKAVRDQNPFTISFPNSQAALSIRNIASSLIEGQKMTVTGMTRFLTRLKRLFG